MNKIAIVCDSSISFNEEELEKYDVYMVPNIIMHNEKTYLDQVDIFNQQIYDLLEQGETVTTSQPNLGDIIEVFKDIKSKEYDYVIVLTISSSLSGGFNAFSQGAKQAGLENYSVIDTHTIAGPVQQAIVAIRKLNKEGKTTEEILEYLDYLFLNQTSYLYPKTLNQIVASGRLSKTAGKLAMLLKVKVAVYLDESAKKIERLAVARTDKKIFDTIIKHMKEHDIIPSTHDLYLLESNALDQVEKFKDYLFDKLGEFDYKVIDLPAGLSVHAGVGAIVLQWVLKI